MQLNEGTNRLLLPIPERKSGGLRLMPFFPVLRIQTVDVSFLSPLCFDRLALPVSHRVEVRSLRDFPRRWRSQHSGAHRHGSSGFECR